MNVIYILLPITLTLLLLFSYNVEGFDYSDQTKENIIQSDNWCNCDKTCNFTNSNSSDSEKVKDLNDTCDINYNFIEGLEKTDNKQQDLVNFCDGCIDIYRLKCRKRIGGLDAINQADAWCSRVKGSTITGAPVLDRCPNGRGTAGDTYQMTLSRYNMSGYGSSMILPCHANQNPFQRWKRLGRDAPGKQLGNDRIYGLKDDID